MFSKSFQVKRVTSDDSKPMLEVLPVGSPVTPGPYLRVEGDPTRKVIVRGGRGIFDENKNRLPGSLLLIDPPDFDIQSLVGETLIPST
ncbi:MAG: hypothetical protein AAF633_11540 [Chloroflexota bacterium]